MISVIIPLYNKEECICKTVDSVIAQTYPDWECIVVDDGSTDNSCSLVEQYSDGRIRLLRKQNGGPSSARNYGINHSRGEWIIFLDADDYLLPKALEVYRYNSLQQKKYKCFSANYYIQEGNTFSRYSYLMHKGKVVNPYKKWLTKQFMPRTGATMFHRDVLLENLFFEDLRRYEDAELVFRILKHHCFYNISQPLMVYNHNSKAASILNSGIYRDYVGHLNIETSTTFWQKVLCYEFYLKAKALYPKEATSLYNKDDYEKILYRFALKYVSGYRKINILLRRVL